MTTALQAQRAAHQRWMYHTREPGVSDALFEAQIKLLGEDWSREQEKYQAAVAAYTAAKVYVRDRFRKEVLYHEEPADIEVTWDAKWTKKERAEVQEGIEAWRLIVGRQRMDGEQVHVDKLANGKRAHYWNDIVHLAADDLRNGEVVVHEFGHWVEQRNDNTAALIQAEYDRRTAGWPLVPMGGNYRTDEKTREDKWAERYMGVAYPQARAHEVFSMGIQMIWAMPDRFLAKDEESWRITWDVLHTGPHVLERGE